jgi:hypothetical protein
MCIPKNVTAEYIGLKTQGSSLKPSLSVPSSTDQGSGLCAALLVGHVFILMTAECNTMAERKLGQAGRDYPLKNSCNSVVKIAAFSSYKICDTLWI